MFVKVAIYIEARLHTVHALRTALSIVSVSLAAVNAPLEGNFVHCSSTTQQHTGWAAVKILFSSLSPASRFLLGLYCEDHDTNVDHCTVHCNIWRLKAREERKEESLAFSSVPTSE